jgi:hypothetical protein
MARHTALIPHHILCLVGSDLDFGDLERTLDEVGGGGFSLDREYSEYEPDPRMPRAFEASLTAPTFTDADHEAVAEHDTVAYVFSPPVLEPTALDVSRRTLAVAAALLGTEGTALKNETSGLTHGRSTWLELAQEAAEAQGTLELATTLYRAWVKRPITDDGVLFSCGMHLLGQPDVELEPARPGDRQHLTECVTTMDVFASYLLAEQPEQGVKDGEGFRLTADDPRWILRETPCDRFDMMDDPSYNCYGYWRLTPDDV